MLFLPEGTSIRKSSFATSRCTEYFSTTFAFDFRLGMAKNCSDPQATCVESEREREREKEVDE